MDRFIHFILSAWRCKKPIFILACAFLTGLISGVLFSMSASGALYSAMRTALSSRVSIIGLLSAILLPLLLSALAVYISKVWLLIPAAFCKAFLFAYLGTATLVSFGSAAWLVRPLLMFSDLLSIPVLWWYWLKALSSDRLYPGSSIAAVFALLLIGSVDYCVVSPFLANLIS